MRMCADGTGPATKSVDSPDTEKMALDSDVQEEDEQVDDEVHMTDVTPSHPTTKFVIDEEDSEDETVTATKQQRREATLLAEALAYGQQLQEDYHNDPREEVKRVLGEAFSLLAYTDPRGSVVGHLLEESGRREVAEDLNSAILGTRVLLKMGINNSFNGKELIGAAGNGGTTCFQFGSGIGRPWCDDCLSHQCQG